MGIAYLNLWNTSTVSHWHDPAWRNHYYYNMSKTPILGDFMRMEDWNNYWNDYFSNRPDSGGWANAAYPTLMKGAGTASGGSVGATRFVSKNLKSLYR